MVSQPNASQPKLVNVKITKYAYEVDAANPPEMVMVRQAVVNEIQKGRVQVTIQQRWPQDPWGGQRIWVTPSQLSPTK